MVTKLMTDAVHAAIDNNVGFYRTILGGHGIEFRVEDRLAYTREKAPTYYSNAVTRSKSWRPDAAFLDIVHRAQKEGWDDWSIKDSFAVLDLSQAGFERLFSAEWLYLNPAMLRPSGDDELRFEVIRTTQALAAWLNRWDADPDLGATIFRPELLSDPDICFLAGYADDGLVCGCVINRTSTVLGLSNCFSLGGLAPSWSSALEAAFRRLGAAPVVGYARGTLADGLKDIGFTAVGQLQVWRHGPA